MLTWLRKEWLFVLAVLVFCLFWGLAFSGHLPLPPPYQGSACEAANQCEQNSPLADFWDWLFGDATSFFTFVLAIFTGALVWTARKADKTAAGMVEIARRQMLISGQQTDILEKQKEIQRRQYLAEHRPRCASSAP